MGTERINLTFQELRRRGGKALVPFLMAGDPEIGVTEELILAASSSGADLIELGVPFSDPLADGPVIQKASQRALARGINPEEVLQLVERLRFRVTQPLLLLTYYNPVFRYGTDKFLARASAAGVDGLVIPDLPLEERDNVVKKKKKWGCPVALIPLLAPTSTPWSIEQTSLTGEGFIYCVSVTGVTGIRKSFSAEVKGLVEKIRYCSSLPLLIGFGISSPEQALKAATIADGVIIGSVLVQEVERCNGSPREAVIKISHKIKSFKKALESNCFLDIQGADS